MSTLSMALVSMTLTVALMGLTIGTGIINCEVYIYICIVGTGYYGSTLGILESHWPATKATFKQSWSTLGHGLVAYNLGLLCLNDGLRSGRVAHHFGLAFKGSACFPLSSTGDWSTGSFTSRKRSIPAARRQEIWPPAAAGSHGSHM